MSRSEQNNSDVTDKVLELAEAFPQVNEQMWRAAVDHVLLRSRKELSAKERDALFERSMTAKTYDGIVIKALYTECDIPPITLGEPGFPPFTRGSTVSGGLPFGWDVRQRVELEGDGSETEATILNELENGTTSIWLGVAGKPDTAALNRALRGVQLNLAPVIVDAGRYCPDVAREFINLWTARGLAAESLHGSFGADPLGVSASEGTSPPVQTHEETVELARLCTQHYPNFRAIVVDAIRYHEAGASDAEEIACATATGVQYLRWLTDAGLELDAALSQLEFRFAATADQFMTMAKLRAARRVWNRIGEVAGASLDARGQRQHAVTSRVMITRYDPWVNLLRTTVACMAAGVAGANAITVIPYDDASATTASHLGRRLARNTQVILIEEAHLSRVLDPAGGSWCIETLSDTLARTAWEWFTTLEAAGGMAQGLTQGIVQKRIAQTWSRRSQNLARRRDPVTGVSEFPDIAEQGPEIPCPPAYQPEGGNNALPVVRYAAAFEELRARADRAAQEEGNRPSIFLATLGPLSEHTARATFCKNLFEAGGIRAISSGTVDANSVAEAYRQSQARLVCVCGVAERYAAEAEAVVQELAKAGAACIYLAGDPGTLRGALEAVGVHEFVIAGCDAVALLTTALEAAGVRT